MVSFSPDTTVLFFQDFSLISGYNIVNSILRVVWKELRRLSDQKYLSTFITPLSAFSQFSLLYSSAQKHVILLILFRFECTVCQPRWVSLKEKNHPHVLLWTFPFSNVTWIFIQACYSNVYRSPLGFDASCLFVSYIGGWEQISPFICKDTAVVV